MALAGRRPLLLLAALWLVTGSGGGGGGRAKGESAVGAATGCAVESLRVHLRCGHVAILSPPMPGINIEKLLFDVQRRLKSETAVIWMTSLEEISAALSLERTGNTRLLVVVVWRNSNTTNTLLLKLSQQWELSSRVWLLLHSSETLVSDNSEERSAEELQAEDALLEGVFPPPDCLLLLGRWRRRSLRLESAYRPAPATPLAFAAWGRWDADGGGDGEGGSCGRLTAGSRDALAGRQDLGGTTLAVTAINFPPHICLEFQDGKPVITDGYFHRIWRILQEVHNFTMEIVLPWDGGTWGLLGANGSWDGMTGLVERRHVDAAINGFIMNAPRATVGDFSQSLMLFKAHVFVRTQGLEKADLGVELRAFEPSLWAALALVTAAVSALFLAALCLAEPPPARHQRVAAASGALLSAFAVFCCQSHEPPQVSGSVRGGALVGYLCGAVLFAAFASQSVALSSVQRPRLPFRSWTDMLRHGRMAVTSVPASVLLNDLRMSSDATLRAFYERLVAPAMRSPPSSALEGLTAACAPSGSYGYYISLDVYAHNRRKLPCVLVALPEAKSLYWLGNMFPQRSPYRRLFQRSGERARGAGLLSYSQRHVWPDMKAVERASAAAEEATAVFQSVGVAQVQTLLVALAAGAAAAVLFLAAETLTRADGAGGSHSQWTKRKLGRWEKVRCFKSLHSSTNHFNCGIELL